MHPTQTHCAGFGDNLPAIDGHGPHIGADGDADPAPNPNPPNPNPDAVANDALPTDAANDLPVIPLDREDGGDSVEAHPGTGISDTPLEAEFYVIDFEELVGSNDPTPFSRPSCWQVDLLLVLLNVYRTLQTLLPFQVLTRSFLFDLTNAVFNLLVCMCCC